MKTNIPAKTENFLKMYSSELSRILPHSLKGVYIYGSISLGDYDEISSDIDLLAILKRPMNSEEFSELKKLHDRILEEYEDGKKLDALFIQLSDLNKESKEVKPYPYSHNGVLHEAGYWDRNSITWWILKKHGIVLMGSDVNELNIGVTVEDIKATMNYNLNTYWKKQINDIFLEDEDISWVVSILCRIIYTLENSDVLSKTQATRYALNVLPEKWHLLIRECLRIRERSSDESLYSSVDKRATDVSEFIKYVIDDCNKTYFIEQ